jgi:ABC-type multidrug transport system fused ATPase/permease subunit
MSIIPQDPFLFEGTIRQNVDPTNIYSDSQIIEALEKCHLTNTTNNFQITTQIEENGKNLSCGEKQLICLTRAILAKKSILLIDEATSSVDFQTDQLIQQTIKNEFKNVTILTIAHRINTIIDYDKVIVMSNGQIAEFDTISNLIKDENSLFKRLVNEMDSVSSKNEDVQRQQSNDSIQILWKSS